MDTLHRREDARQLLALVAEEYWGLSPLPELRRAPLGKPYLLHHPDRHFNLSHSGPYALCALDHGPVGVDIQICKPWQPRLPQRVCSPAQLAWLEAQPDPTMGFTVLWALKEARVKQSGLGLRQELREIAVPLPVHWGDPSPLDGLWFRVWTGPDWAAAACGSQPPPPQIQWRSVPPTII